MAIKYIDPGLGERTLIVFSVEAHQAELVRLKRLGYEITHPAQDDIEPVLALYTFQRLGRPGQFWDISAWGYAEALETLATKVEDTNEWRLYK